MKTFLVIFSICFLSIEGHCQEKDSIGMSELIDLIRHRVTVDPFEGYNEKRIGQIRREKVRGFDFTTLTSNKSTNDKNCFWIYYDTIGRVATMHDVDKNNWRKKYTYDFFYEGNFVFISLNVITKIKGRKLTAMGPSKILILDRAKNKLVHFDSLSYEPVNSICTLLDGQLRPVRSVSFLNGTVYVQSQITSDVTGTTIIHYNPRREEKFGPDSTLTDLYFLLDEHTQDISPSRSVYIKKMIIPYSLYENREFTVTVNAPYEN